MESFSISVRAGSAWAALFALTALSGSAYGETPDIFGTYWATEYQAKIRVGGGGDLPLTPAGKEAYEKNIAGLKDGSIIDIARRYCVPDGLPRVLATPFHVIERYHLIEDGKVLEANIHVEDPGAFTIPWDAIQRFRQYEAAVAQVPIERLAQLASAPEGPLVEMNCADNPNSYFSGTTALPIPQAVVPDF